MLSVSQFSKISHITTKTLRYYDEIDLFKPAQVNEENGYRYYDTRQLSTILCIQKLKSYEFSLEDIKLVLTNKIELPSLFEKKKIDIESKITAYSSLLSTIEQDLEALVKGKNIMLSNEKYEITVVENQEINILSIRKTMNVKEYSNILNALYMKIDSEKLTPVALPMTIYHSPEYTPESDDMEIAVPILQETKDTRIFHTGRCAKLTYVGKYDELPKAYVQISQWIEENNFELCGATFEMYLTDPNNTPPQKNEVEIYCPIKKK